MRTQKTDNSGTTYYYYDSDKNLIGLTKGNATLLFYYDSDSNVTSFKYNGTMYYYIKNLQGDVVKIINQSSTEVADYNYDAWGNIESQSGNSTILSLNPFHYRSYVYDNETGLYYLQSRYYDPVMGRFLNSDEYCDKLTGVLGTNMFAYCKNNPLKYADYNGKFPVITIVIASIVAQIASTWVCTRSTLHDLGTSVLYWMDCPLAAAMYSHSIYGYGDNLSREVMDFLKLKLKSYTVLQYYYDKNGNIKSQNVNFINNLLYEILIDNKFRKRNSDYIYGLWEIEFSDKDLYYAIQHCNIYITGKRCKDLWTFNLRFSDQFNFDEFRLVSGLSFANAANDLGLLMQLFKMITPYWWYVDIIIYMEAI